MEKKCELCGKEVTQEQLDLGDAVLLKDGKYYHIDCLDDQMRQPDDVYRR